MMKIEKFWISKDQKQKDILIWTSVMELSVKFKICSIKITEDKSKNNSQENKYKSKVI